ncbi:5-formyltetrahydrofolate cyclo-ligase [Flagellimonas sp. HMM57]|uniref:5-formyltetrahydrofolate cyclo-ligase n=1 Tax=unclassified Flagellimonas TaxID=2644544 RepID=UPI0013D0F363|nr:MULTISPECIES: 5-formyltetrahydrofolate cyclo-ligase [unclassified Flagellimonas]UII77914.1 5-formyltetrahydrofolate cyclo-ligase [Flagellimonas sp. HMM57]
MLKHELRKKYKDLRQELSLEEVSDLSITLANRILQIPIWDFFYFHIFLSIDEQKEIDTQPILAILQGKDKNVIIPKVNGENILENYLLLDNTVLKKNKWGIPEPVDGIIVPENKIDVVFLPLLAFDLKGNRVGYGKGYYDTFLNNCRKETIKIGLSLFEAETSTHETHEHDVGLDYCVTPDRVYKF